MRHRPEAHPHTQALAVRRLDVERAAGALRAAKRFAARYRLDFHAQLRVDEARGALRDAQRRVREYLREHPELAG